MDKENIMLKEFIRSIGGYYPIKMVAIYNKSKISESEVNKIIQKGIEHDQVIIITRKKYDLVFGK